MKGISSLIRRCTGVWRSSGTAEVTLLRLGWAGHLNRPGLQIPHGLPTSLPQRPVTAAWGGAGLECFLGRRAGGGRSPCPSRPYPWDIA